MKTLLLTLLAAASLSACVVVPAEPSVVVGGPAFYVKPSPVLVVPDRPYYGYGRGYGYGPGQRYGYPRYRPYYRD